MASKKFDSTVAEYATILGEIAELSSKLHALSATKAEMEQAFHSELAEGMHPAGHYILEVATKITKGRKTTSWKSVAEGVSETLPGITEALSEAFPAEAASFKKFEAEATALHDDLLAEATKVGPDKSEPVITLHDAAGKKGKGEPEAEADEPKAEKPRRKHHLRVVGAA
jgi:hypothetical protein